MSRTDACLWGTSGLWGSRGGKGCGDEASVLCKVMGSHGRYVGKGGPCGLCILGVSPRVTSRTMRGERKGERRQETQRGSEWNCQTSSHTQISSLDMKDNSTQASSIIHTPRGVLERSKVPPSTFRSICLLLCGLPAQPLKCPNEESSHHLTRQAISSGINVTADKIPEALVGCSRATISVWGTLVTHLLRTCSNPGGRRPPFSSPFGSCAGRSW